MGYTRITIVANRPTVNDVGPRAGRKTSLDSGPASGDNFAARGGPVPLARRNGTEDFVSKQALLTCLKYALGLGLLAWVVWANWEPADGSPGLAAALQKDIRVGPLLLAGALALGGILLTFVRWYVLVRAQGLPFTLPGAMRLGMVGYYFNTFLPGSVGGDIIKAACIARQQSRRTVAVATVLIDRVIGLCGLFWLVALIGGIFWTTGRLQRLAVSPAAAVGLETITLGAAALAAGSVVFWVLLGVLPVRWTERLADRLARIPKLGPALAELWRAVWMYRCQGRRVGLALAMAMLGHCGFVVAFYCASLTLNPASEIPPLGAHFLLVPVGATIKAGFPTPGGVGGGEAAFGWLYTVAGYAAAGGVLAALVQRALDWTLGLTGYLVYLRMRPALPPTTPEDGPATGLSPALAAPPAVELGTRFALSSHEARPGEPL